MRAATIRITPISSATKIAPVVGNVPALGGMDFFTASEPANASAGIFIMKRPSSITIARVEL